MYCRSSRQTRCRQLNRPEPLTSGTVQFGDGRYNSVTHQMDSADSDDFTELNHQLFYLGYFNLFLPI